MIIGAILFVGGGDDDDPGNQGLVATTVSGTATEDSGSILESATNTSTTEATSGPNTATSTSRAVPPTATTEVDDPTATINEEPEEVDPTEAETDTEDHEDTEPTEEPVESVPDPTEEPPLVGDFGTLPPAQVVSGGTSRTLNLDFELATSLSNSPSSAIVYLLEFPAWTESDVESLAANLGLDGEVEGGPGNYQVFGSTAEIYFSGSTIQYVYTGTLPDLELGSDSAVIQSASDWIYANGFIGGDLDGGAVIGRDDEAGRAVVLFRPADVSPVLSFVPSATVTIGPGGTVVEARIRWPSDYIGSEYGLWSGDTLWNRILAGQGSVEADLSGVAGSGALSGTMAVYEIWIAYSYAGSPGSDEYLVPLVVFSGEATINETGDVVPVSIYVPAVAGQSTPQG